MSVKGVIDSAGNINTVFLEKELLDALASDVKYKQVDNMKKRAVKTATDYNEFKAMVACAHLKKISSKEVASLSDAKKGWKKATMIKSGESVQLLSQSIDLEGQPGHKMIKKSNLFPKSCMELERDLRRMNTIEEKQMFLSKWGIKRATAVLKKVADTDVIEDLLTIVLTKAENCELLDSNDDATPTLSVDWLVAISTFDKFNLAIRFASKALVASALRLLAEQHEYSVACCPAMVASDELQLALSRYRCVTEDQSG